MRLKYQLFLTLLAASAVLIAIMYAISSWSFSRGFLSYVNHNEAEQRLTPIADALINGYETHGSWEWAQREPDLWKSLPKPRNSTARSSKDDQRRGSGPKKGGRPRLVLADVSKSILVGKVRPNDKLHWRALVFDDELVGYLGLVKFSRVNKQFDQAFELQQKKSFGLIALSMAIISALLSIPLASRIVRPLLRVTDTVSEISNGNYGTTLSIESQDEIGALAQNINGLSHTLEQNRKARQTWIAEISHELRTPLAVMRSELEAIQDGVREADANAIASIHMEALSLGRLVDDLHTLSMSDLGALDYRLEAVDISNVIDKVIDSHQTSINERKLAITREGFEANLFTNADAQRLEQLFSNLLQNSIRYTDVGGDISVTIERSRTGKREIIVVEWQDSHQGVSDSALTKLFDPLFRVEASRNRSSGGAGLGLAIVKKIVDAHNGSITASHSSLGGLKITLSLPSTGGRV